MDQLALHSVQLDYLKILQMGNTDPNNTKAGKKKYEVKPQYEELSKQLIMQHAIINAMKCMRAIKGRIARPVNQLANHLNRASIPRMVYQPGKSSVRDLQSPSAHHSSVVFRHNQSVGHHSDDSVGLFRHDTSVGQSQRGSKSGHQSICQSGSRCMHVCQFNIQCTMHTIQYVKTECKTQSIHKLYHVNHRSISADFTTSITAMFTLKAVKFAQFVPPTADFYLNRYNKTRQFQPAPTSFHLAPSTTAEAILNLKSVKETHIQFISSSNLNFNT
ncbi:eukaryotic translation initiation factor 4G-like [Dorcoceras hygrometricum]|uniref:Eukaryotic translation initiation factor 4G-like n=1 Tax=Dorcoceras hygrometricum TaxID=472368 RepID=A0A2Z7AD47_9LAMI|nr:eukaryotic translation initiation factor 4G-like [Dorcoceras hygrometricum]